MAKRQITTMCPMNCHPTYCGMTVELEEDRLVTIKGDLQNPDSRGFLCLRGRSAHEIINNPRRLRSPLRRVGSRGEDAWAPCSWKEALTLIVDAIQQTRRDRVGIWPGHGSLVTGVNRPLLMRFGYLGGFQGRNPAIGCWAFGGYGPRPDRNLEANTKKEKAPNPRT